MSGILNSHYAIRRWNFDVEFFYYVYANEAVRGWLVGLELGSGRVSDWVEGCLSIYLRMNGAR